MARRAIPQETKDRVFAMIDQGLEPVKIAAETGVSPQTVANWKAKRQGSVAPGTAPIPPEGQGTAEPAPIQEPAGSPLPDLMAKHPGTIPGETPAAPQLPIAPPEPKPVPMAPEALLALVCVTKGLIVQTASAAWKIKVSEEEIRALAEFSESETQALKILAPYASEYTASMSNYAKPFMAVLFAGVVGFSTVTSLKALRSKLPPKAKNVMVKEKGKRKR